MRVKYQTLWSRNDGYNTTEDKKKIDATEEEGTRCFKFKYQKWLVVYQG